MSATATSTSSPVSDHSGISPRASARVVVEATTPRSLFDDLIFDNAEVCSDCFAKIRDETTNDTDGWGSGNQPGTVRQRVSDGEVAHDDDIHDDYGAIRSYHTATACGVCGQFHGRARDETLGRQAALSRLPTLIRRLHEQRLAVNVQAMYDAVSHLKSHPNYQGKDTEIFAAATWLGLKNAVDDD